jgi:hypothetical protein
MKLYLLLIDYSENKAGCVHKRKPARQQGRKYLFRNYALADARASVCATEFW